MRFFKDTAGTSALTILFSLSLIFCTSLRASTPTPPVPPHAESLQEALCIPDGAGSFFRLMLNRYPSNWPPYVGGRPWKTIFANAKDSKATFVIHIFWKHPDGELRIILGTVPYKSLPLPPYYGSYQLIFTDPRALIMHGPFQARACAAVPALFSAAPQTYRPSFLSHAPHPVIGQTLPQESAQLLSQIPALAQIRPVPVSTTPSPSALSPTSSPTEREVQKLTNLPETDAQPTAKETMQHEDQIQEEQLRAAQEVAAKRKNRECRKAQEKEARAAAAATQAAEQERQRLAQVERVERKRQAQEEIPIVQEEKHGQQSLTSSQPAPRKRQVPAPLAQDGTIANAQMIRNVRDACAKKEWSNALAIARELTSPFEHTKAVLTIVRALVKEGLDEEVRELTDAAADVLAGVREKQDRAILLQYLIHHPRSMDEKEKHLKEAGTLGDVRAETEWHLLQLKKAPAECAQNCVHKNALRFFESQQTNKNLLIYRPRYLGMIQAVQAGCIPERRRTSTIGRLVKEVSNLSEQDGDAIRLALARVVPAVEPRATAHAPEPQAKKPQERDPIQEAVKVGDFDRAKTLIIEMFDHIVARRKKAGYSARVAVGDIVHLLEEKVEKGNLADHNTRIQLLIMIHSLVQHFGEELQTKQGKLVELLERIPHDGAEEIPVRHAAFLNEQRQVLDRSVNCAGARSEIQGRWSSVFLRPLLRGISQGLGGNTYLITPTV